MVNIAGLDKKLIAKIGAGSQMITSGQIQEGQVIDTIDSAKNADDVTIQDGSISQGEESTALIRSQSSTIAKKP